MNSRDLLVALNGAVDLERLTDQAIQIARSPCPQTALYDREPMILRAIREMYRPAYESAGCETWIDDYGSLIATQDSGAPGRSLLFISYAMTWTEGTMTSPWSGEVLDGTDFEVDGPIVWGRGGSEYHPTNAGLLECAQIINALGGPTFGKITYVVSSGGHTSSMDPIYHLVHSNELKADLCIMPGNKSVVLGNMGRVDIRLNLWGTSVHSGGDLSMGNNAITDGLEALHRLTELMPYPPAGIEDPDMGKGRLSVIGLASYPFSPGYHDGVGSGGHTLQNLMRIMLDRRLPPGQDAQAAIEEIRDVLSDALSCRFTLERGALQLPSKHSQDAEIVTTVASAYETVLGRPPKHEYVDYTIDAGYLNNVVSIPTIMFGAMDMRFAHGDNDFMKIADVVDLAKIFSFWALSNGGV